MGGVIYRGWNFGGNSVVEVVVREFGARSEAVSWSTHEWRGGILRVFCCAVQRYDEHLGFCKFFGKKMQEKCIFVEFWAKNDDYLERIAILSTANRIDGRTGAKVYRVYKVYLNM